jgi:hypothetical protein
MRAPFALGTGRVGHAGVSIARASGQLLLPGKQPIQAAGIVPTPSRA